jgi:hypothetical protein
MYGVEAIHRIVSLSAKRNRPFSPTSIKACYDLRFCRSKFRSRNSVSHGLLNSNVFNLSSCDDHEEFFIIECFPVQYSMPARYGAQISSLALV